VLRDGFDVEAINKAWSIDIEESSTLATNDDTTSSKATGGAVESFEEQIRDPRLDALQATSSETNGSKLEVSSLESQAFLATQLEVLEKIRQGSEPSGMDSSRLAPGRAISQSGIDNGDDTPGDEGRVNEHIGPVQFNMGGIQVDADDMLQRLKVCILLSPSCPFFLSLIQILGSTNLPNSRTRIPRTRHGRWEVPK
jgi:dynein light intermediate chain 1